MKKSFGIKKKTARFEYATVGVEANKRVCMCETYENQYEHIIMNEWRLNELVFRYSSQFIHRWQQRRFLAVQSLVEKKLIHFSI